MERTDQEYLNGKGALKNSILISDEVKTALDAMLDSIGNESGVAISYNTLIRYMADETLAHTKDGKSKSNVLDKLNKFHMNQK